MVSRIIKIVPIIIFAPIIIAAFTSSRQAQKSVDTPISAVPKTWDGKALASLELPLADSKASPVFVSPDYYYRVRIRPVYKTYPIYALGKEPAGYMEWLKQQKAEIVFDPAKLKTEQDWIEAGKLVYHSPIAYGVIVNEAELKNPEWYKKVAPPIARDGTIPFVRYGIREDGKVEVGILSCGTCHSRVMPDGTFVDGVQGNFAYNRAIAWSYRKYHSLEFVRWDVRLMYGTPWMKPDPHAKLIHGSMDEICSHEESIPPGVIARNGTSPLYPTKIPNLIGIKDVRYLDFTGLVRHREIGDLMRYAALAQGIDFVSRYGSFIPHAEEDLPIHAAAELDRRRDGSFMPTAEGDARTLPVPETLEAKRYSDEMLYALALYLYSLQPPQNPNKFDALAARGKEVFEREGCTVCHTPPLYTNNKLTPVEGFKVPEDLRKKYDIMSISVGTDPSLALRTRRGTGLYKVPSLRGLWLHDVFGHSGSVASLEDWFDPRRTSDNYVPTGFRGYGVKTQAIKGHAYGLDLSGGDRKALIAFLKTL